MLFSGWLHSLTNRLARSLSTSRNRIHRRTEWKDRTTHSAQIRRIDELESRCLPSTIAITDNGTKLTIEYTNAATVRISASGTNFLVEATGAIPETISNHNSLTTIEVKPIGTATAQLIDLGAVIKSLSTPATFALLEHVTVWGGGASDSIVGTSIGDVINAGHGTNTVVGGSGDDSITGGDGKDNFKGSDGNDTLIGGNQNDSLVGDSGEDRLNGDAGNDNLNGGADNDILDGGAGVDLLVGDVGNDSLDGGTEDDVLNGNDGTDTLNGGADQDSLFGGNGNDFLDGGANTSTGDGDTLYGEAGNDILRGGTGDDVLYGGADNDRLLGDEDNDILLGGFGDDWLGELVVTGLTGSQTLTFVAVNGTDPAKITRAAAAENFVSDGFRIGQKILVSGTVSNNGVFEVSGVTATELSLVGNAVASETPSNATLKVKVVSVVAASGLSLTFAAASGNTPARISRASGSFVTDGFGEGQSVTVIGASINNNVTFTIRSLTAEILTLGAGQPLEAGLSTTAVTLKTLFTEPGNDLLVGGYGADSINGGIQSDILIGGAIEYERGNGGTALTSIRSQWTNIASTFEARRNAILNGAYHLALNGAAPTVYNDYQSNTVDAGDLAANDGDTLGNSNVSPSIPPSLGNDDWFFVNDEKLTYETVPGTERYDASGKDTIVGVQTSEAGVSAENLNPSKPAWLNSSMDARPGYLQTLNGTTRITGNPGQTMPGLPADLWGGIVTNRYVTESAWNNDGTVIRLHTVDAGDQGDLPANLLLDTTTKDPVTGQPTYAVTELVTSSTTLSGGDWRWSLNPTTPNAQYSFYEGLKKNSAGQWVEGDAGTNSIKLQSNVKSLTANPPTINFNGQFRILFGGNETLAYVNGKEYVALLGVPWETTTTQINNGTAQMWLCVVNITDSTTTPVIVKKEPITGGSGFQPSGLTAATTFKNVVPTEIFYSPDGK